ncbi:MAG TPA: MgtC/SapB family protein [Candidatus Saccharibacteria bacterium]|nr:MgtC/SapB family protein [Candidatus Saccharibacteria bacterium]
MFENLVGARELEFLFDLGLALLCGIIIGVERELKNKPAGISTQTLVISGAMMFAFMSRTIGDGDPTRIAAQIVSGIGFLGAGIILKSESKNRVSNVTTAASIWYAAAIGMALGFNMHFIAIAAALYAVIISRIPHISTGSDD